MKKIQIELPDMDGVAREAKYSSTAKYFGLEDHGLPFQCWLEIAPDTMKNLREC